MSRIESAVNRARATESAAQSVGVVPEGTPEAELFVGPWEVSQEPEPTVVTTQSLAPSPSTSAVPAPVESQAPASSHGLTLSIVPAPTLRFREDTVERLVGFDVHVPAAVEQYRRLAAKLHQAQIDRQLNTIMVVSAVPSEGKTLTSLNLALTLTRSYKRRVLLIDADLRRPSLHEVCGLPADRGLQEAVLSPSANGSLPVYEVANALALLPAGQPTSDPMGVLTSARMRAILEEGRRQFDWVIVDTAPMAALSDAAVLKDAVDGALLVVSAGNTPYDLVERATSALGRDYILGVVLNGVDAREVASAYGYAGYYGRPK